MTDDEIMQRAIAFNASVKAGRLTRDKVLETIARWLLCDMITETEHSKLISFIV